MARIVHAFVPSRFRPSNYLENLVLERTRGHVRVGPFANMRWIFGPGPEARIHIPKLLGIYERELNPYVERACALNISLFVDVGAAEGYYAVGMALRNPAMRIIAFEMEGEERSALVETAKLNNVEQRVEVRGKCEPEDLHGALAGSPRPLVVCDTEGYESVLLDPARVPSLTRAFILVELHEFIVKGVTERIRAWYAGTHKISQICQEKRAPAEFPYKDFYTRWLPESYLHWAVNESRPEQMSWFWMEPQVAQ